MDRRRFLRLASGIAAGGGLLGAGGRSWAQGAPAQRPGARPAAPVAEPLTASVPGVGAPLTLSAERHQGLDSVHFIHIDGGRWVPVTDWTTAVRA